MLNSRKSSAVKTEANRPLKSLSDSLKGKQDEYYPISKKNVESYNTFMFENLFSKVDIPKKNINIPNGELNQRINLCY